MTTKKIGLALSGGGARGYAHIGVLKVIVEHGIPIDYISGTSVGSIVGGAFAAGMSAEAIAKIAFSAGWRHMTWPSFSPLGMFTNAPLGTFIRRNFPVTRFEELKIPLTVVACDMMSGKEIRLTGRGDLVTAIRASCAVPAVFTPVKNGDGKLLVDGGVVANVPVDAVRAMGADVVIAVDLISYGANFRRKPRSAVGMLFNSAMTALRCASSTQATRADVVIAPRIAHIRPDRLRQRNECLALGEEIGREMIEEIKRVINDQ
jgi:NTE family protein